MFASSRSVGHHRVNNSEHPKVRLLSSCSTIRQDAMADTGTTYTPDPDLAKLLASTGETLLQFVSRHVELIKTRESTGSYPGDGPRSEQIDSLLAALEEMRPVFEIPPPLVGV